MATTLVSALGRVEVRKDVAMTGEITLRGKVLAIGGVKEKVLAAHRAGLKNIVLPKDNEKDLADIPKNVLDALDIYLVENMDEVLKIALVNPLSAMTGTAAAETAVQPPIADGANHSLKIVPAEFVTSVSASGEGIPRDDLPQVALAGRSNVGKSSLINALVREAGAHQRGPGKAAWSTSIASSWAMFAGPRCISWICRGLRIRAGRS